MSDESWVMSWEKDGEWLFPASSLALALSLALPAKQANFLIFFIS